MSHLMESLLEKTLAQVFSCEFCEISKDTFSTEHLWTTTSDFSTAWFDLARHCVRRRKYSGAEANILMISHQR